MTEEWCDAPAPYEGYQVSTYGRIRNARTQQIKKITIDHRGSPRVSMFIDGKSYSHRAHHVVWHTLHGSIPYGCYIVPRDGDWMNIHPSNLECISVSESRRRAWEAYNDEMDRLFAEAWKEFHG